MAADHDLYFFSYNSHKPVDRRWGIELRYTYNGFFTCYYKESAHAAVGFIDLAYLRSIE